MQDVPDRPGSVLCRHRQQVPDRQLAQDQRVQQTDLGLARVQQARAQHEDLHQQGRAARATPAARKQGNVQAPGHGHQRPTNDTSIDELNPCPLNALAHVPIVSGTLVI